MSRLLSGRRSESWVIVLTGRDGLGGRTVRAKSATGSRPDVLFGRSEDRAVLDDLVEAARGGRSGSLVILGEPGIGKTRLLRHAIEAAVGAQVVRIAGVESEVQLPYAAVHRLLVPFLGRLDRLPTPHADALRLTFGLVEGQAPQRFLVGLGVLSLLADVSGERPLMCVVDDAQWLDRESLEVLAFVCRRLCSDRIGVLFGGREHSSGLSALDGLPTRRLGGLDSIAARRLLDARIAGPLHGRVATRIITETGGNPLAMLELVGRLTLDQVTGRSALPPQLPVGRRVDAHFLSLVESLPADVQVFLLLASAASGDDPVALWRAAALLGVPPSAADPAVADDIVSLYPRLAFRHPLIRSAVYNGATASDRRRVHHALATIADLDGCLDEAAWHRAAATAVPDEAVAADLERSAERAESRGGQLAQAAFLARAAELTPDARARAARWLAAARAHLAAGDGVLAEALLDRAAPWVDDAGTHAEVQRLRASIAVFFSRHKDAPAILLDAVTEIDPSEVARVREMLFEALQATVVARQYTAGTTPLAVARAALRAPRPTRTLGGTDLLLDGFATRIAVGYAPAVPLLRTAVAAMFSEDELATAGISATILGWFAADDVWDEHGRRAMFERAEAVQRRHGLLGALRVTLAGLCTSHVWTGKMGAAEDSYLEAAEISALIGVPTPAITGVLLELRAWQGRERESRDIAATTARWGLERGAPILEFFALIGLTLLEVGLGRYAEALAAGLRIYDDDPPGFGNRVLPEIVEAGVRGGDRGAADAALTRLARRATVSGTPWALGMLARSRALLARDVDAEAHYREAVEHLQQTSVRTELARAHLLYGEWLRRQRRRRSAQTQLRTACTMFDDMGAVAFAGRARAELLASGYRTENRVSRPSLDLTPQEAQVSRLAANGSTNAEIAARLFVTSSTVEYHLSKVFRKLDITSRRQLATALNR